MDLDKSIHFFFSLNRKLKWKKVKSETNKSVQPVRKDGDYRGFNNFYL